MTCFKLLLPAKTSGVGREDRSLVSMSALILNQTTWPHRFNTPEKATAVHVLGRGLGVSVLLRKLTPLILGGIHVETGSSSGGRAACG